MSLRRDDRLCEWLEFVLAPALSDRFTSDAEAPYALTESLTLRPPSARTMQWPNFQPQPHAHPDGPRWQGVHLICCLIGGSDVGINPPFLPRSPCLGL